MKKTDLQKRVGIIGCGNMGSVIALNLNRQAAYAVSVLDKDKAKLNNITGVRIAKDAKDLVSLSDVVMLAVKPQDFDLLLKEIKGCVGSKLVISIAAGISTKHIEKIIGNTPVIRAMPNIGVKICESVTCLSKGIFAQDEDLKLSQELFYFLGTTRCIDEGLMNAATAISGSGPAYLFYFVENSSLDVQNIPEHARHDMMRRLEQAAVDLGFDIEDAAFLAANTINASINLLRKSNLSAFKLREQVTSKGGTTEAAIAVLSKGGTWTDAARAALKRAEELARRD
jgi:pyrroline-5-carboxylate reductase